MTGRDKAKNIEGEKGGEKGGEKKK